MDTFDRIKKSIDYGALDHKWLIRNYLWEKGQGELTEEDQKWYQHAVSPFNYVLEHYKVFQEDDSLRTVTGLCSNEVLTLHTEHGDSQVFHLSNVFNQIIESTRGLHKCYDCGTNARAMFLKLIETHRGVPFVTHNEQVRMKREYQVTNDQAKVAQQMKECLDRLLTVQQDTVFIMSLAIQKFGHVWIIEKRFIQGVPRYHHYQTSLRSHLLLDFIEAKDYGRDPHQSLDVVRFFDDLKSILSNTRPWQEEDYRLFAKMFAFIPVSQVTEPKPGFSFTSVTY